MDDESKQTEARFGQHFAETWSRLQRYLADLNPKELAAISSADFAGTLEMLKRQPALGHAGALQRAEGKSPEELAIAIIQERLDALTGSLSSGPSGSWGGRFLERWRELGGPLSSFNYAQIQTLKHGDREQVMQAFRGATYQGRQLLKNVSPEAAADALLTQYRMGHLLIASVLLQ